MYHCSATGRLRLVLVLIQKHKLFMKCSLCQNRFEYFRSKTIVKICAKAVMYVMLSTCAYVRMWQVWSVRVDVHVLDYGGNVIDCAAMASAVALKTFRFKQ